jgi:hypothetical protein
MRCTRGSSRARRAEKYRLEYEDARVEAKLASADLQQALAGRVAHVAAAARRAQLAAARLYTAAACILSPP